MAKYNDVDIGQMEACVNRMGGMQNFLSFIGGQGEIVFKAILALVAVVKIPAQPRFVASEEFVVNTSDKAEVKIAFIWDGFKPFLKKVEEPTEEMELRVSSLTKDSLDEPILAELNNKARVSLSQFYAMLKKQGRGQKDGPLLVNGYANIFYIEGEASLVVRAYWDAEVGGWGVGAHSVQDPDGWGAGFQVVSRN